MLALVAVQAPSTVPFLLLPHSLFFPLTNQGQIFNWMSPIDNPPPTPVVVATSRLNHRSCRPKPQARERFSQSCHHRYPFLSLKPSLSTSFTTGVLFEEGGYFFFFISTPPLNPPDLAVTILHPLRSLSFPQSLTLSSSSHRVYHVYVVNKCFYFDFWLC